MFYRFKIENQIYSELGRLPLHARMKLDLVGIKISLPQWLTFKLDERRVICHLPVESPEERDVFAAYVNFLCIRSNGGPAQQVAPLSGALWDTPGQVPEPVLERSRDHGQTITLDEWKHWQFHQRYALYKTAVSKNEPEKFTALLSELRQSKTDAGS